VVRVPARGGSQISAGGWIVVCSERAMAGGDDGEENSASVFVKARTNVRDPYYDKNLLSRELREKCESELFGSILY
jgi:hypothetical protein